MSWPLQPLRQIAEFRNGINYNKGSFGTGMRVIGVKDFQNHSTPRYAELEQINPAGVVTERDHLRDGDILFVRSNGNRELIGRSLYIANPPETITHSAFTIRVRFPPGRLFPRFYAYLFRTPIIRAALSAQGGGTNISNLNQDILSRLLVPVPALEVQRQVAGVLAAYDDLIENNLRRIRILGEMARALYRDWFVDFRFPGHHATPLVSSELGNVPRDWAVRPVGESFEVRGGGTPSRAEPRFWIDGDMCWFAPRDLTAAGTVFIEASKEKINQTGLAGSSATLFPAYSVMLTSRATIGAIAVNTVPAATNQGFITCLPNDRVPLWFLYWWVRENVPTFERLASGATFKEISRGVFKTVPFLHPPTDLVRRFESLVSLGPGVMAF